MQFALMLALAFALSLGSGGCFLTDDEESHLIDRVEVCVKSKNCSATGQAEGQIGGRLMLDLRLDPFGKALTFKGVPLKTGRRHYSFDEDLVLVDGAEQCTSMDTVAFFSGKEEFDQAFDVRDVELTKMRFVAASTGRKVFAFPRSLQFENGIARGVFTVTCKR